MVHQVERRSHLKRRIGQAIFVYAAFSTWFRHYDRNRPRFAFRFPDGATVDDGYFAIVLNSNPYTFLGVRPFNLSPDTGPDRGLVAVTIRSLKVFTLLRLVGSALAGGKLVRKHRKVDYRPDLMSFTVAGHGPFPYQVDGDYLGEVDELDVHLRARPPPPHQHPPRALRPPVACRGRLAPGGGLVVATGRATKAKKRTGRGPLGPPTLARRTAVPGGFSRSYSR